MEKNVFWPVGLTVGSSEKKEIVKWAADEGRSQANMVRKLVREAANARRAKEET